MGRTLGRSGVILLFDNNSCVKCSVQLFPPTLLLERFAASVTWGKHFKLRNSEFLVFLL